MTTRACRGNFKLRFEHWPVVGLWPISLILMQATLLEVGDFAVTVAVVACHLLQLHLIMLYWLNRPPHWQIALALVILAVSLGAGAFARDLPEFLRSLAHVTNTVVMVLICLNLRLGRGEEVGRSFALFCVLASAVALVIVVQAISFNLWRDFRLAGLLGPFAPAGPGGEIYAPSPGAALPRANGLYSEPSVAGWFMTFAAALGLAARRLRPALGTLTAAACSLGAMATLSLTGILGPVLVWASYLLLVRDRWRFKAVCALIAGSGMLAALHQAHELGILSRFDHLNTPGTSIYFRLSAPYRLIGESLERYPLGYPLGQTDFIASRHYYINWDQGSQTNVDNTLLMIVFYFGLLGILCNAAYLLKAAQFLVLKRHAVGLVMLSLLIAASTTGAGWAHHFVLMTGYAIVVGRWLYQRPPASLPHPRPAMALPGSLGRAEAGLRRAQRREQLALPLLRDAEVARLDVAKAADLLRHSGEFHRNGVIGGGKLLQDLRHDRLVLGDQAPLQPALRAVAERVERRAAQPLEPGQLAHDRQHPRAVGLLSGPPGRRIPPGEERRRQVDLERRLPLELAP
jgi:hypothetical protein